MTRDTKIGLLLGLVFIFIIAFLINGLPRLRGRNQNTPSRVARTPIVAPGLGQRERLVGQTMPGPVFPSPATSAGQPQPGQAAPGLTFSVRSLTWRSWPEGCP